MSSETSLIVRRLKAEEGDLFKKLRLAALAESPDAFGETVEQAEGSDWEERTRSIFEGEDRIVLIGECDGDACGIAFAFSDGGEEDVARVGGMWVHPDKRRRGLARALLREAVEWADDTGKQRVELWVASNGAPANALFENAGFESNGRRGLLRAGSEVEIKELVLQLAPTQPRPGNAEA